MSPPVVLTLIVAFATGVTVTPTVRVTIPVMAPALPGRAKLRPPVVAPALTVIAVAEVKPTWLLKNCVTKPFA